MSVYARTLDRICETRCAPPLGSSVAKECAQGIDVRCHRHTAPAVGAAVREVPVNIGWHQFGERAACGSVPSEKHSRSAVPLINSAGSESPLNLHPLAELIKFPSKGGSNYRVSPPPQKSEPRSGQ